MSKKSNLRRSIIRRLERMQKYTWLAIAWEYTDEWDDVILNLEDAFPVPRDSFNFSENLKLHQRASEIIGMIREYRSMS